LPAPYHGQLVPTSTGSCLLLSSCLLSCPFLVTYRAYFHVRVWLLLFLQLPQNTFFASLGMAFFHSVPSSLTPLAFTSAHPNSTHCLCHQEIISILGLHWALYTCLMTLVRKSYIITMYLSHVPGRQNGRMVPKIPTPRCTHPT